MENYYKRETCRLCDSKKLEMVMEFSPTPPGDEYVNADALNIKQEVFPLELVFCNECGFLQVPNIVEPEFLYKNYTYETTVSLNLDEHFKRYADQTVDFLKLDKGSVVYDLGCNVGSLLGYFKKNGMNEVGVEPASGIAKKASAKGLNVVNDFFTNSLSSDLKTKFGEADLVCANNVLANIDHLKDFFMGVNNLMKKSGVFIFETGYMIDLIVNDVIDNVHHEHVSYFSIYPLQKYLKSLGMELFHVEHVDTKGGSMRFFIQKEDGKHSVSENVLKFLKKEIDLGFKDSAVLSKFGRKHSEERAKLQKLLADLKAQGKRIAGYGASVGGTTLLYYYGIHDQIEFLVDDNTIKQGMFSPGLHVPVYSPQKLISDKIDYVVNFAWRYADPIMKGNQEFIKLGGKLIQPLPEVKIL